MPYCSWVERASYLGPGEYLPKLIFTRSSWQDNVGSKWMILNGIGLRRHSREGCIPRSNWARHEDGVMSWEVLYGSLHIAPTNLTSRGFVMEALSSMKSVHHIINHDTCSFRATAWGAAQKPTRILPAAWDDTVSIFVPEEHENCNKTRILLVRSSLWKHKQRSWQLHGVSG